VQTYRRCAAPHGWREIHIQSAFVHKEDKMKKFIFIASILSVFILSACAPEQVSIPGIGSGSPTPVQITPAAPDLAPTSSPTPQSVTPTAQATPAVTTPQAPATQPPAESPAPVIPDTGQAMVDMVTQDLAQRLRVDASAIRVVNVEGVEWSNSALGCPEPGMNYLTVITPGYRIILEANGSEHTYHTDRDRYFVLCVGGRPAP
jgi:hypothetical protein